MISFTLCETPIGPCGIAWSERGVVGVQLPEESMAAVRDRMLRRWPEARQSTPPPVVQHALLAIAAHLRGEPGDLTEIGLDLEGVPLFDRRVYDVTRGIPAGATLTYGEVAERLNAPGSARAVGASLAANPFPLIVPCHRVLAAGGKLGGFSAAGGVTLKRRLLAIERAPVADVLSLFED